MSKYKIRRVGTIEELDGQLFPFDWVFEGPLIPPTNFVGDEMRYAGYTIQELQDIIDRTEESRNKGS